MNEKFDDAKVEYNKMIDGLIQSLNLELNVIKSQFVLKEKE